MKTAIILGGTGLVGSRLIDLLLSDSRYGKVTALVRRPLNKSHKKLNEEIINFDKPVEWKNLIRGDEFYSCLGTTIKTAGSKAAQYKVDYSYQLTAAEFAATNGIKKYMLISSAGANVNSKMFYSRMKGKLDRDVKLLPFESITIIKPSVLVGKREQKRKGEDFAAKALQFLIKFIPQLKKYKPIDAEIVARAMINSANNQSHGVHEIELDEVFHAAVIEQS